MLPTPAALTSYGPLGRSLLVWRFPEPVECLSSAPVGGGRATITWMLNATVAADFDHFDLGSFVRTITEAHGLSGPGVGFLTAADVAWFESANDEGVLAESSVGATKPTWASDAYDGHNTWSPGTINTVVQCPVPLSPAAAVNAVVSLTEAKTQALVEAAVPGTGTASDAIAIVWPSTGDTAQFGGPRSEWGARIARATHATVAQGLRSHP